MRIEDGSGASLDLDFQKPPLGDWVVTKLKAESKWFGGGFQLNLHRGELQALLENLQRLHKDLAGAYCFESYEGQLRLDFAMGKREDLALTVRLQNHPELLHELRLYLNINQSQIPAITKNLHDVLTAF